MGGTDSGEQMSCCVVKPACAEIQYQSRCCCDVSENQEMPVDGNVILPGGETSKRDIKQHSTHNVTATAVRAILNVAETPKSRYLTCNSHPPDIPIYNFVSAYLI